MLNGERAMAIFQDECLTVAEQRATKIAHKAMELFFIEKSSLHDACSQRGFRPNMHHQDSKSN
jgi:hypothetical protein